MEVLRSVKNIALFVICVFGLGAQAAVNIATLPSAKVQTMSDAGSYLRSRASTGSTVLRTIPPRTQITIYKQPYGSWWPASYIVNGRKMLGWIHRSRFTLLQGSRQSEGTYCATCAQHTSQLSKNVAQLRRVQPAVTASSRNISKTPIWPVQGRVTSGFGGWRVDNKSTGAGHRHNGIDIAVPEGTHVRTPLDGVVTVSSGGCRNGYSRCNGRMGNTISIRHSNGLVSQFMHLSPKCGLPKVGTVFRQGDTVACSGNTGHSTGPHLHWGVYHNGEGIDPKSLLNRSA